MSILLVFYNYGVYHNHAGFLNRKKYHSSFVFFTIPVNTMGVGYGSPGFDSWISTLGVLYRSYFDYFSTHRE